MNFRVFGICGDRSHVLRREILEVASQRGHSNVVIRSTALYMNCRLHAIDVIAAIKSTLTLSISRSTTFGTLYLELDFSVDNFWTSDFATSVIFSEFMDVMASYESQIVGHRKCTHDVAQTTQQYRNSDI